MRMVVIMIPLTQKKYSENIFEKNIYSENIFEKKNAKKLKHIALKIVYSRNYEKRVKVE